MKKGIDVKLKKEHLHFIRKLDNSKKGIFGAAFLYKQPLDFRIKDDSLNIELSEREKEIVKQLKEVRSIE